MINVYTCGSIIKRLNSLKLQAGSCCCVFSLMYLRAFCCFCSLTQTRAQSPAGKTAEDDKLPESQLTWWMTEDPERDSEERSDLCASSARRSRWDFSIIPFPDVGSRDCSPGCLAPPDPSVLPGDLAVGVCDVAAWKDKINLRQVKMSAEQQRRENRGRRRWDVNKAKEVNKQKLNNTTL